MYIIRTQSIKFVIVFLGRIKRSRYSYFILRSLVCVAALSVRLVATYIIGCSKQQSSSFTPFQRDLNNTLPSCILFTRGQTVDTCALFPQTLCMICGHIPRLKQFVAIDWMYIVFRYLELGSIGSLLVSTPSAGIE